MKTTHLVLVKTRYPQKAHVPWLRTKCEARSQSFLQSSSLYMRRALLKLVHLAILLCRALLSLPLPLTLPLSRLRSQPRVHLLVLLKNCQVQSQSPLLLKTLFMLLRVGHHRKTNPVCRCRDFPKDQTLMRIDRSARVSILLPRTFKRKMVQFVLVVLQVLGTPRPENKVRCFCPTQRRLSYDDMGPIFTISFSYYFFYSPFLLSLRFTSIPLPYVSSFFRVIYVIFPSRTSFLSFLKISILISLVMFSFFVGV